ncbi:antitoxin PHD, partial [Escherichia coli]|nr:antitoxin PHD [Escherichia coli]
MPTKAELQARIDILEKENASLKGMLARAERELSGKLLPEELPPADIP